ncbi:hypothetical protein RND81_10G144300 [Saponaria officinalis]|uniref:Peptidase A1 domain-containing protein n=1 Tax=Saponaria officinalis TaxID=3572 RepID=A0AAW1I4H0_SAPOF
MANNVTSFLISFLLILLLTVQCTLSHEQGFTANLIHRESPLSPLKTTSLNQYERLRNSIKRSMSKINRFGISATRDLQSQVKVSEGAYIMELYVGTPPVRQLGIVDTGSDLIWTQCQPCVKCYNQTLPIFDPTKSASYKAKSCNSEACKALPKSLSICSRKNACGYIYRYGDRSHTIGFMGSETLTFKSGDGKEVISFPNINFGCGHTNTGIFSNGSSGLVGLGGGPLSLVSQLNSTINGKFSSFYYLTLEGISVGKTKISSYERSYSPAPSPATNDNTTNEGNIIIDSGTTLTILPFQLYRDFRSALETAIKGKQTKDPMGLMDLCYKTRKGRDDLYSPIITFHFTGGDLVLNRYNTFVLVSDEVLCLAIVPSPRGQIVGILGYIAQMDFLVGYDTVKGKVSFKRTNCAKK